MKQITVFSIHPEICKFWRNAGYRWFVMRNEVFYACVNNVEKLIGYVNCNNRIVYYLNEEVMLQEEILRLIKLKAFL